MKAREIMTKNPVVCTPETGLQAVATMMCDTNCGEIPVVESMSNQTPVGVITDRDITCRVVAKGLNPRELKAASCMSSPALTVGQDTELQECCEILEGHQIRRVPVVDKQGRCCGIVAQADIVLRCPPDVASEVVKEVSQPVVA
ncbi:MAG TPA: CBS domain-containing protein [Elusimicrobiota bacterium]|nr:CBS domain-containing protein [Elusimicrobiota bacterium]